MTDALDTIQQTIKVALDDAYARGKAAGRAEADANSARVALGKRLLTKRQVWEKLGWSQATLDRQRRADKRFPKARELIPDKPQWLEDEIDDYMNGVKR